MHLCLPWEVNADVYVDEQSFAQKYFVLIFFQIILSLFYQDIILFLLTDQYIANYM